MDKELRLSEQTQKEVLPADVCARLGRWHRRLGFAVAELAMLVREVISWRREPEDCLSICIENGQVVWLGCSRGSLSRGTLVVTRTMWNPFRLDAAALVRESTCRSDSGFIRPSDGVPIR